MRVLGKEVWFGLCSHLDISKAKSRLFNNGPGSPRCSLIGAEGFSSCKIRMWDLVGVCHSSNFVHRFSRVSSRPKP